MSLTGLPLQWYGLRLLAGTMKNYEFDWYVRTTPRHVLDLALVPVVIVLVSLLEVGGSVASYRRSRGVLRTFFALVGVLALLGSLAAGLEAAILLLKLTPWIPINGHRSSAMLLFPSLWPGWQELWRRSPRDSALTTISDAECQISGTPWTNDACLP